MNLVNLESAAKAYGTRVLLDHVSLGVAIGDRIGVVGRNGSGKTTLLAALAGVGELDSGRSTRSRDATIGYLPQAEQLTGEVRQIVFGAAPEHEWAVDIRGRALLAALLSDIDLAATAERLSGGERRRVALAALLRGTHDLLLLDEPTNHLDIEAIRWLAGYLTTYGKAFVVVTHDRWFLDAVSQRTWEISDGQIHSYEGGYSAYVLARAERARIAAAEDQRRRNLLRKELAWLRRGPPARTSKPKFRIDAATALIADEPEPRDAVELAQLATARLGKTVIELTDVTVTAGIRLLLDDVSWQLGPGDRVGVVGVNGTGKTTLLRLLAGAIPVPGSAAGLSADGAMLTGKTVRLGYLTQEPTPVDPRLRALEAAEQAGGSVRIGKREISASQLLERLGLRGDRQWTPVAELSGGEQRRLQFQMILMAEPNVLLLDEPTNDLDIETLTELEDLLDGFPGSVMVVSHDRYFLERVTDHVLALIDGKLAFLPGGIDEYLALRDRGEAMAAGSRVLAEPALARSSPSRPTGTSEPRPTGSSASRSAGSSASRSSGSPASRSAGSPASSPTASPASGSSSSRQAKKEIAKLDRQLQRLAGQEADLQQALVRAAADYPRLIELGNELRTLQTERETLEERWLTLAEQLSE